MVGVNVAELQELMENKQGEINVSLNLNKLHRRKNHSKEVTNRRQTRLVSEDWKTIKRNTPLNKKVHLSRLQRLITASDRGSSPSFAQSVERGRKYTAEENQPREIFPALLASRIARDHFFSSQFNFFRVTHDGLSERGVTRGLHQ